MSHYLNRVTESDFIEGVSCDFGIGIANSLNERCNKFVDADAARGLAQYAVTDFDNVDQAVSEMHSALDVATEAFGLETK